MASSTQELDFSGIRGGLCPAYFAPLLGEGKGDFAGALSAAKDQALDELSLLLKIPSDVNYGVLCLDPAWDRSGMIRALPKSLPPLRRRRRNRRPVRVRACAAQLTALQP